MQLVKILFGVGISFVGQQAYAADDWLDRAVPRAQRTPYTLQISRECENVLSYFEWKKFGISERLVGFWENESLGISDSKFNDLIVAEREAVREKGKKLSSYVAREFLRGATAVLAGWGNCGEHTSTLWSDLALKYSNGGLFGCQGAEIFETRVKVDGKDRDHVWIEVWVPFDPTNTVVRLNSAEEPSVLMGARAGRPGYYLVFDAGSDETGPYRVIRKIVRETDGRIPSPSEYVIDRYKMDPTLLSTEDVRQAHALAFEVSRSITTREQKNKTGGTFMPEPAVTSAKASSSGWEWRQR